MEEAAAEEATAEEAAPSTAEAVTEAMAEAATEEATQWECKVVETDLTVTYRCIPLHTVTHCYIPKVVEMDPARLPIIAARATASKSKDGKSKGGATAPSTSKESAKSKDGKSKGGATAPSTSKESASLLKAWGCAKQRFDGGSTTTDGTIAKRQRCGASCEGERRARTTAAEGAAMAAAFSESDGRAVARRYRHDFRRIPRDAQFAADEGDGGAVARYELARQHLRHATQLGRFGFRLIAEFVTPQVAREVAQECDLCVVVCNGMERCVMVWNGGSRSGHWLRRYILLHAVTSRYPPLHPVAC